MPAIPQHLMTVEECLAWVPPVEWGCWELIDGKPRWRFRHPQPTDCVAKTPEELIRLLDNEHGDEPGPAKSTL
jgi:hypothetical protein